MPTMITGEVLRRSVERSEFLQHGDINCAEGIKYDFRMSSRILKASFGRPINISELSAAEQALLFVEPGEMVFVLTEERLKLPRNMMAELSPKRKLSHAGILAIGGFCIDPKYEGRLIVGLFNFSSTRFPLIPGKKVIGATFHELATEELGEFGEPSPPLEDFPDELVQIMQRYVPVSVASLHEAYERIRLELDTLRNEIRSHDEWYKRFEQSLDRHDKQIADLLYGLSSEKEARQAGQDRIAEQLQKIDHELDTGRAQLQKIDKDLGGEREARKDQVHKLDRILAWLRGAAWVVGAIMTVIAIPIIVLWLQKAFGLK